MAEALLSHLPWLWFAVTVAAVVAEVFTTQLAAIWIGAGAALAMLLSFIPGFGILFQIPVFAAASAALLIFCRPLAIRTMKNATMKKPTGKESRTTPPEE